MTGEKRTAPALWLFFLALLFTGCSTPDASPTGDRSPVGQVSAATAAEFGDVALPAGSEVLGADSDSGIDTRYRLALRMTAAQLRELLSQFKEQPRASEIPRTTPVIAGPQLSDAPNPLYAQDRVTTTAGRTVYRDIIVDERSPDEVYVHLSMFTT
ncbi:hypothetical protein [Mycobacterium sp. NPDC050441]|uniref:hypothetical protein n=1 Tax=Mycobacterium sp. NPDC050441 TaxID=3155403 RepID=UPI0033D0A76E